MRRTVTAVALLLTLAGCADDKKDAQPDQELRPDCRGRFADGEVYDFTFDRDRPSNMHRDPRDVVAIYASEETKEDRPDAALYDLAHFERRDATSYYGSSDSGAVGQFSRWVGSRDDGSIFAVVILEQVGSDGGLALKEDQGCLNRTPSEASGARVWTPLPSASRFALGRDRVNLRTINCFGRYEELSPADYSTGVMANMDLPTDPEDVLATWLAKEREDHPTRPEFSLYARTNFDQHPRTTDRGLNQPEPGREVVRWAGYRPDGTIFALVWLDHFEKNDGWVVASSQACSSVHPDDESPTPAPTLLDP